MKVVKTDKLSLEPKLVPILREGIDVIKMVLYKELRMALRVKHGGMDEDGINMLTGSAVNRLFGVQNLEERYTAFEKENRKVIANVLKEIPMTCGHLRIPLTDALRMQFLCDSHEGVDSASVLEKAKALTVLIIEREVPLPGAFMSMVRSFGVAYKILKPQ